jgi:hypothetical protein
MGVKSSKEEIIQDFTKKYLRDDNGKLFMEVQTVKTKDGTTYTGFLKNNTFEGEGILFSVDKSVYLGTFVNGSYHGEGIMLFPNDDKYEG